MKRVAFIAGLILITGCAQNAPSFSWHHPEGGEYLFAYDQTQCSEQVTASGAALGTDVNGPFFQCMLDRGYYLINQDRIVRAPSSTLPQVGSAR